MLYLLTDAMGSTMDSIGPQEEVIQQAELILRRALLGPDNNSYSYYLRNVDYSYFQKSVATFKKSLSSRSYFSGMSFKMMHKNYCLYWIIVSLSLMIMPQPSISAVCLMAMKVFSRFPMMLVLSIG